ncbi:hypothetical protein Bca4012_100630 [Brassica carinata]
MVRRNEPASLKTKRQAFHGRDRRTRPWAKYKRLGEWFGLMTDHKPNQNKRWDANGQKGTTLGRWCPSASKSCMFVGQDLPPRFL